MNERMTEYQELILAAMLKSDLFKGEKLRSILKHLTECSFPNTEETRSKRKADYISAEYFGGSEAAVVRNTIMRVREHAQKFAKTEEGQRFSEKLVVQPGGKALTSYLVSFEPNEPPAPVLEEFWAPHLCGGEATTIVRSEPLFFRL